MNNNKIYRFIKVALIMFGALFIGILMHELYHFLTLQNVTQACLQFGGGSFMFLVGEGSSSEVIAYAVTFIVTILGIIFGLYDLIHRNR